MNRILVLLLFISVACTETSPYNCPDLDEQYKPMHHKDSDNLGRKKYRFKKAVPNADKRKEYGTDKENLDK